MKSFPITFKSLGKDAILIEWPNKVREDILADIIRFKTLLKIKLRGDFEFVPAYNSLAIIDNAKTSDLTKLENKLSGLYTKRTNTGLDERVLWKLPVCYDKDFGIDLVEVASNLKMTIPALIQMHASYEYTVYGIGFLPGFMYLGGLPDKIETTRRATPRLKVEKGAVGLAGKQTGIYPQESPGGWNIIGNCPIPIFNVKKEEPCFVSVGDKIKFIPVNRAEYDLHKIEAEVGIYTPEKIIINA